jgi:hypothetical protein
MADIINWINWRTLSPTHHARVAMLCVGVCAGAPIAGGACAQSVAPAADAVLDAAGAPLADTPDFSLLLDPAPNTPDRRAPLAWPSYLAAPPATVGSRTDKADGSVTLSAGQRLPTPWDAKVGVDLAAPAPLPGQTGEDRGSGWANVAVPAAPIGLDKATIDARVDPNADQTKLSTALSRSVPVIGGLSLTLQNAYSVTQSLASPSGIPGPNTRVYSGDGGVRLEFPSATALSAGAKMSSTDERLTPSLRAEQKLFDSPFSITGTISQRPTGETDRSITAGFKRTW